ncbi:MAG TPA: SpoIIE family protein phosphatase [Pyrinomonadaceae bacterium]|jgi:serine phosphatase RsbU (regulator of sigma subunit)|nr:SpoIIE family protein phosphatase [Pyrinomonadaceae bacterium]
MPELIVKYPDRAPDRFPLGRLRITLGRSARNDLCIPDPFASRVHAEVRREGEEYYLQDLGSANGTLYNGGTVEGTVPLTAGGRIQIGETEIVFDDGTYHSSMGATMITDNSSTSLPEATIALASGDRTTSGLLEAIEGARKQPEVSAVARVAREGDLLALISKVGITLLSSSTLEQTLEQIVSLVFEAVPADRCLLMMRDEHSEEMKVAVARLRDRVGEVGEIRVSRNVMDEVVIRGKSVLTSDAQHDPRFASGTVVLQGVRSVLAVPLGVSESVFGIIYADSPIAEGRFTEDHLKVLTTLASVAAIRVENARLVEARFQQERLERELQLAMEIQQRFQPTAPPIVPGYELQGISFPCYEIGGDYYDFIRREDGRLVIALGDVSGKGTAAALLMSSLHAAIHAQTGSHDSLVETISAVNRYLAENIPPNRFVTLFYAELDPDSGALSFLNAGHNPPLIVHSAGTVEQLASGGLPLGIKADADYREGRTTLQPGDVLVIYSDGVTEAASPNGEEFGPTRLYEVVSRNVDASAAGIRDRIESALTKFSQGTQAADDITLVIVKRQAETRQLSMSGIAR